MNGGQKLVSLPVETGSSSTLALGFWGRVAAKINHKFGALIDRPIPQELLADPEIARRARLITRFGVLGSLFGFTYAAFYLLINHKWGTVIILICSSGVAATPFLMRWKKSVDAAGNFLALTLTWGFTALCFTEGGLRGHAIAWLVSVPLCALLLVGQKAAGRWAVISFFAASVVAGVDLAGIKLPLAYDPKWHSVVSSAGYLGLIIFMFILGLIFEAGRARAFAKMQDALAELAASNERLVHLNNEKNEFLGIAAHDLKNPLTAVVGSADLLRMTGDPSHVNKLAHTIASAAKRMSDLINNLLDANAIEQGKFTSNIERCDIGALVEQSVENNQPAATRKTIVIRTGTSPELWARADRAASLQILDNLISNALKYSPPNTTVYVHSLPEKNHILVTVRDEGPGISEADQKKLFQKFSRLSARPTGGESSTGLGLSIVKKLAEAMGGTIQCHSALGAGATFIVRLPVWPKDSSSQTTFSSVKPRIAKALPEPVPHFPVRN
jgi:signal transduction histidine kinase